MADFTQRHDFHQSGFQFVNVELDTGLTFARIALGAKGARKVERNRRNARRAYDSAMHILSSLVLENDQAAALREKLDSLRSSLQKLGEEL